MSNQARNVLANSVQVVMEPQSKTPFASESSKVNASTNSPKKSTTIIATDAKSGQSIELSYYDWKAVGSGSFGFVYEAMLSDSQTKVAIKKVLQDKRFKNRELQIMRMLDHQNIVELKSFFYSNGEKKDEVFLNLVLEFVPETIYRANRYFIKQKQQFPLLLIKLYIYQLFRSLAYIHSLGICHRDIKPQNLLLDSVTGILKLCDFGSAKILVSNESNVSYICSRYYRAPELIFGASNYTTQIDIWSTGCILAELALGRPIFPGESGVDQLVEIIKILGTPEKQQVLAMNPNYTEHNFPPIKAQNWTNVFTLKPSEEFLSLISVLLRYEPNSRPTAIEAMCHPFFNELRSRDCRLTSERPLPPLFNFSKLELAIRSDLVKKLLPEPNEEFHSVLTSNNLPLESVSST